MAKFNIEGEKSGDILIDNGEFRVAVKKTFFDSVCGEKGVPPEQQDLIWAAFDEFNQRVITELAQGRHLGSTDPISAIQNELFKLREKQPSVPEFSDQEVKESLKED